MFLIPKNMSGQKNFRSPLECMYVCWGDVISSCVYMSVYGIFSFAWKLLWLYQFSGETVSPSGFEENSLQMYSIDESCPVEI